MLLKQVRHRQNERFADVIDHFSARSQLVPAYLDTRKWSKQQAVLVAARVYLTNEFTQI